MEKLEVKLEFFSKIMVEQHIKLKKMREDMDQRLQNRIIGVSIIEIQRLNNN